MNKKKVFMFVAVLVLTTLTAFASCKQTTKTNQVIDEEEAVEQADEEDENVKTVKVNNATDLILAIANNRRIVITTTTALNLTDALDRLIESGTVKHFWVHGEPRTEPGVYYLPEYDGNLLVVSGLKNITIEGKGEAHLQVTPRYADVVRFQNCNNICLKDIVMGHTDTGDCIGDVLGFYNCNNVEVDDCGLYGCGVNGVHAEGCNNMEFDGTHIYDCDQFGIVFSGVNNAHFENCHIYKNGCGIQTDEDCNNILFNKCEITDNRGMLFNCYSKVTIKKSKIEHHHDDITENIDLIDCNVVMDYRDAEVLPDIEPDED